MKNNARTHGSKGRVGYRTPSAFRFQTMRRANELRAKVYRVRLKTAAVRPWMKGLINIVGGADTLRGKAPRCHGRKPVDALQ